MDQYNLPGQTQGGSQNRQSLSSTTNSSRYQHSLAPAADSLQYYASGQSAGFQAYPYESYHQNSPMSVPQSQYLQGQPPSHYSQTPTGQQGAFNASGQPLRHLPFTNVNPSSGHDRQGHQRPGSYATGQSASRGSQSYGPIDPSAQYGLAATSYPAQHMPRYIPTPAQTMQSPQYAAQTMQSQQYASSRGATSGSNIVIPPPSSPSPGVERYPCDKCDRTFSRPHDRKRHFESQHMLTSHTCSYCRKEFSRADSLKRHLDNGCDKMPPS